MGPGRSGNSTFKEWRKRQAYRVLPVISALGTLFVKMVGLTTRIRFTGDREARELVRSGKPFVLAFFHGRLFLLINGLKGWPLVVMTSISYMGEIQTRIAEDFGYATVRGSRSRGGSRALALITGRVRKGSVGVFAVDGPRGPYRDVKPGAVYVAGKLGVPVVPVSTSAHPSVILKSWDRFLVPMPFSRGVIHLGKPLPPVQDMTEDSVVAYCERIGRELEKLEAEADAFNGRTGE